MDRDALLESNCRIAVLFTDVVLSDLAARRGNKLADLQTIKHVYHCPRVAYSPGCSTLEPQGERKYYEME